MSTFVLVHGLGLGGWCWKRVAKPLRRDGHRVLSPTLTGTGERVHLANPHVNLDTHVTDVVNVLQWENLHDVVLVGHSYGGAVVTGAADRQPNRIRALVYLDAFVLSNGESVMSRQPAHRVEYYQQRVKEKGDGWLLPPNSAEFYGVTDSDDQAWIDDYSVSQPFASFLQPISLGRAGPPPYARVYIWASGFNPSPFVQFAERYRDDPDWAYFEIPSGHMVMVSHPTELVEVLTTL